MFSKISGVIYCVFSSWLLGYLGGNVVEGSTSLLLYSVFMPSFIVLFISTTVVRIMYPIKKYKFLKYF